MQQVVAQLKQKNNILIAAHIHPDGDAVGSVLGLGLALERIKKKVTLYIEDAIPAVYQFLPSVHQIQKETGDIKQFDAAIILDCSDLHRIGSEAEAVSRIPMLINIDHHTTNTRFGKLQLIDPEASSTAEIVYRVIREMDIPIDKGIAYALYTGIMADTGSFRFSNTTPAAFEISHEMVKCGADPHRVAHHVYETISLNRIKLLTMLFDSIELSENGSLSTMILTQNMLAATGTEVEDVNGLINYARRIEKVKLAVLLYERKARNGRRPASEFHVSLRSDGSVNAAAIATSFGGGGHHNAAGFDIKATLPELKSIIYDISQRI